MINQKKLFLIASAGVLWIATLVWVYQHNIDQSPKKLSVVEDWENKEEQKYLEVYPDFVVDLDDRITMAQIHDLEIHFHAKFDPVSVTKDPSHLYHVSFQPSFDVFNQKELASRLNLLRQNPWIEAADLDFVYSIPEIAPGALTDAKEEGLKGAETHPLVLAADFVPNDPLYKYQWNMDQIKMPKAWQISQGKDVIVAVIDTGVTQVGDLQGTAFVPGWNFVEDNQNTDDDHGHGTHVAGTIAQTTNNGLGVSGIAFKAKIMPIKVLSGQGSGSVAGIAAGVRFAADHGAQVINMSLGGPFNSTALAKAVAYAHDKGVLVVCAAGNDGKGRVSYPGANLGAMAVAATQFDETTTFYSNWGKEIAIAAPGGNTRVDQNQDGVPDGIMQHTVTPGNIEKQDYLLFMGTSMASPHVAGVAALIYSAGVSDPDQVIFIIQATAHKPATYQGRKDPHYGAGIIDAAAALQSIRTGKL